MNRVVGVLMCASVLIGCPTPLLAAFVHLYPDTGRIVVWVDDPEISSASFTLYERVDGQLVPQNEFQHQERGRRQVTVSLTTATHNNQPIVWYAGWYYWWRDYGYYVPVPQDELPFNIQVTFGSMNVEVGVPDGVPLVAEFQLSHAGEYEVQVTGIRGRRDTDTSVTVVEFSGGEQTPAIEINYVPAIGDPFDYYLFGRVVADDPSRYVVATWIGNISGDDRYWSKPNVGTVAELNADGSFSQFITTATQTNGAGQDELTHSIVVAVYRVGASPPECNPCQGLPDISEAIASMVIVR